MTRDSSPPTSDESRAPRGFDPEAVERTILDLAAGCGPDRTLAPADVALAIAPGEHWQRALPQVRRSAVALALAGRLLIYRKGKVIDPAELRGVYRLGLPRND
ncbi:MULTISPECIES: DUF3253 domain-containing protein [unclassified Xanthobacter]|uniref:DUF3253 domain-containing protein n=1 Tax=unclassified Xanthobacter TaxID=2623496 RepID=UPI001F1C9F6F|nr:MULTISPECIES: DUF3253 domain-containing protein [unclassified Xanthobacter]